METKLSNVKKWTGKHRGVSFEINNWINESDDNRECWTFYLLLYLSRIPVKYKPNSFWLKGKKNGSHVFYDYYKHFILSNIEWHCGITFYNKESGFDGSEKVIKAGCDYAHYWDEGRYYSIELVKFDVEKAIDSFLTLVPDYKYWCCGNGKLYDLSDGILKNERFYSKEYYYNTEWFKKLWDESKSIQP